MENLDALCLFGSTWIYYFTGFAFQPTERPVCLVIPRYGESEILVPELERDHVAELGTTIPRVNSYPEYPGESHPMTYLLVMLKRLRLTAARLGFDGDGYGGYWGSQGPRLSDLVPEAQTVSLRPQLMRLRMVKSAAEVAALKESARFGNLAHEILIDHLQEGGSELLISMRASAEATAVMLKAFSFYSVTQWGSSPVHVGIKAGPETAWPHPMGAGRALRRGDNVNTWSLVAIDGYRTELERTLFFGEPTQDQVNAFNAMLFLQSHALQAIRPGRLCSEVERDILDYARDQEVDRFLRHHTGHSLGLESHEPPFLDLGELTEISPGMVFSVEPGIYVPGVGGFRHSDTVVVGEHATEILTYAARTLEEVIIRK